MDEKAERTAGWALEAGDFKQAEAPPLRPHPQAPFTPGPPFLQAPPQPRVAPQITRPLGPVQRSLLPRPEGTVTSHEALEQGRKGESPDTDRLRQEAESSFPTI